MKINSSQSLCQRTASWLVAVTAIWIYVGPHFHLGFTESAPTIALLLFTLGFLALGTLPESLTSLLFFTFGVLCAVAPPAVLFSGFTTGAFWLVFGGLILGEATKKTGLADHIAQFFLTKQPASYQALLGRIIALSALLCFVMPSTPARILILIPLLSAITSRLGLAPGNRGHIGACLAGILVSYYAGATVLTANAPNLVLMGVSENLHKISISYTNYLWAMFPIVGGIKLIVIWLLIAKFFKEPLQPTRPQNITLSSLNAAQKKLGVILCTAFLFWITDSLHHIHPGWIALSAAAVCLLPTVRILDISSLNHGVNIGPLLYLSAALGIGAIISQSDLVNIFSDFILRHLNFSDSTNFANYVKLTILTTLSGLITTNPGQPALLAPLAANIASQIGWPTETTLMLIAIGYSTLLMPYQAPPVIIGLSLSGISIGKATVATLAIAGITFIFLVPINYYWWKYIELIP